MQLTPRYLVNNRVQIVVNDAGFVTEYRPVYQRRIEIYRGINNVLEFKLLNADQKAVSLTGKTAHFQAFDENYNMVLDYNGVALTPTGVFKVTVSENDLLNLQDQFLSYTVFLSDNDNGDKTITYSEPHFRNNGTLHISSGAFPGAKESKSITTFNETSVGSNEWASSTLDSEPGINGNVALHTAVFYTNNFVGDIVVQSTLDNQVTEGTNWADLGTLTFTGSETTPTPYNFNGVFSHIRFLAKADPASKISKILVRN